MQINYAISPTSPPAPPEPLEPGLLVKHYTYDGVGRLVRTQSPYPSPELSTGEVRTERFYYDGVRRVQELVIDPVLSLGEALLSSEPELQQLAGSMAQQSGEPLDPSAAPGLIEQEQLEGVGEPGSPGSPSPSPVSVTLTSEYVWGLGNNGLDELLVKFDKLRKRWWIIQNGGGRAAAWSPSWTRAAAAPCLPMSPASRLERHLQTAPQRNCRLFRPTGRSLGRDAV